MYLHTYFFAVRSPSEKVQFILGDHNIKNDVSNEVPCLFTQMAQLKQENANPVWKEIARYIHYTTAALYVNVKFS